MRRLPGTIVLVLVAAIAVGGCGGDDKSTPAASTPTVTTLTTPTQPARPAKPDALDEAAQRLTRGGYKVAVLDVNPPATAARRIGDHVLLYAYNTPAAAVAGAKVITSAISEHPSRGAVDTEGSRVYFIGDKKDLTAAERAAFADLVDVGEGRTSP